MDSPLSLCVRCGADIRSWALDRPELSIGSAADNDVVLPGPAVAGHHARVRATQGTFSVVSLDAGAPTGINGKPLAVGVATPLLPGDVLQIGSCELWLETPGTGTARRQRAGHSAPADGAGAEAHTVRGERQAQRPPAGGVYGVLQVRLADGAVYEHPILKPEVGFGRADDNDFVLEGNSISRHHLRLVIDPSGAVTASDLGSLNGVLLNGRPLEPRVAYGVPAGGVLQVADYQFALRMPDAQAPAPPAVASSVRIIATPRPVVTAYWRGRSAHFALTKSTLSIGSAADSDISLPIPGLAPYAARLEGGGGHWAIRDLSSSVAYDGRPVAEQALTDGDTVHVGPELTLQLGLIRGFVANADTNDAAPEVLTVGGTGSLANVDTISIGRAKDNTIVVDQSLVSRYHAVIERLGGRRRVRDLKSTNGVFVNGKRVEREAWLKPGDEVRVGQTVLRLADQGVERRTTTGVRLDAVHLHRRVSNTRDLLQDVSLAIRPQEFVALVGLSGAGKTTLLDAISGFRPATEGVVLVDGSDLYRNYGMFRSDIGYVPQKDIVHTELTVYAALDYAAQLRMSADVSAAERRARIMEVLAELDLTERKDLPIGRLSGGQLKRVSIGVELLTKPRLFYLDEPTSGLDPGTEYNMMRLLRRLADQERTVVLVTHATKNVMMCDKVCIMARGGYVAFYGPPEEALLYFDQYRTAQEQRTKDIEFDDTYAILEDEQRGTPEVWGQRYRQSAAFSQYVSRPLQEVAPQAGQQATPRAAGRAHVSAWRQFSVLTRRYLYLVLHDRLLLGTLLAVMPVVGLLLLMMAKPNWLTGDPPEEIERQLEATLAWGAHSAWYGVIFNARNTLFIMALAAVLLGLFAAGLEIVKEWPIYQRERMVAVSIFPYIASKLVVLGAFAVIQCFLLLVVIGAKVHLPSEGVILPAPVEIYVSLLLATLGAILLGLFISAMVPNANTVTYILFTMLFFQMVFAGVMFDLPGPAGSISRLSLMRWATEAVGVSVDIDRLNGLTVTRFRGEPIVQEVSVPVEVPQQTEQGVTTVTQVVTTTVTIEPQTVDVSSAQNLRLSFARSPSHLLGDWLALVGLGAAFALAAGVALRRRDLR